MTELSPAALGYLCDSVSLVCLQIPSRASADAQLPPRPSHVLVGCKSLRATGVILTAATALTHILCVYKFLPAHCRYGPHTAPTPVQSGAGGQASGRPRGAGCRHVVVGGRDGGLRCGEARSRTPCTENPFTAAVS